MEYNFSTIEKKWQDYWSKNSTYKIVEDTSRPKFYILDMFPYPSGAGLHVGHPLGYIASDIYARYKTHKGFNVLHPMGFDAYGLPAEQYAIQTGQHPEVTTYKNIDRYKEQLAKIGFGYDWDREIRTSEPGYYKWTQWAFLRMFGSYYDNIQNKALPIEQLVSHFEHKGTEGLDVACSDEIYFTAEEWKGKSEKEQQEILMNYRIAYLGETMVNWCAALGTVLANDEVSEGLSVRGGYPVEQRKMKQWCLRISAYADRLLSGLEGLNWTESLKETQRNWIGKSEGAEIKFHIADSDAVITVFTTRVDTLFGVSFMVLAPESEYVSVITSSEYREEVEAYLDATKKKTERERISDRRVTGVFTGGYAIHPITKQPIPIWISDYVLSGYGTGAIMAVPAHDSRDFAFAHHFGLPILPVVKPLDGELLPVEEWKDSLDSKEGVMINSDFLNGLSVRDAIAEMKNYIHDHDLGRVKTNFRLRDAIFSRQRYWGEPFPIYYKEGMPYPLPEEQLPLELPEVDKFLPTESGEPPLGRAKDWKTQDGYPLELSTMPGFAGSSAYYLRYMDPHNPEALVDKQKNEYWKNVDLYIGGTEHATGHLIYSRFWNKFLFDLGIICEDEPFKKLINQGMIQGRSNFVYRIKETNTFVSLGLKDQYDTTAIHVDVNIVHNDRLDLDAFKRWMPEFATAEFILEDGEYICGYAVEKMSKSLFNVVNPDDIVAQYGADTLRLYEMFLGPLEQSKPWDTKGIDGVHRFLRKFVGLYDNITDEKPSSEEYKILHTLIKKLGQGIESFSFNTCVSAFMICVNDLQAGRCSKIQILEPLAILLSPFAPHLAEELWQYLGHQNTITREPYPMLEEKYLVEAEINYPVSFNGKVRFQLSLPADMDKNEVEKVALSHPDTAKWLVEATPKKVIVVPGKIINIVH
ncbi:leucine--tRNA ligase [Porphyromonas canoris]|uniref:Leucine--tRNA ligase n=1 Tax=Porphyromonas canoris TaxID=36875 RepID=A0ABR4XML3_9PORP|nr:leucine--tRNA ligase [Porphyromonas canoris]KGN93331.1 leucyl-tRNA synthetase [Porphyromonas canoris]